MVCVQGKLWAFKWNERSAASSWISKTQAVWSVRLNAKRDSPDSKQKRFFQDRYSRRRCSCLHHQPLSRQCRQLCVKHVSCVGRTERTHRKLLLTSSDASRCERTPPATRKTEYNAGVTPRLLAPTAPPEYCTSTQRMRQHPAEQYLALTAVLLSTSRNKGYRLSRLGIWTFSS